MRGFSLKKRRDDLERVGEAPVDVVVVGGGITGAGVAREAALRGLDVVLLDRGDFASGTSSRSSKLIHGGVRYLEQGDIALVREAARERAVLRRIAPHLAAPVRMLLPARSRGGKMKLAAGLWTFERLAGSSDEKPHEVLDRKSTIGAEPGLRSEALSGSVAFTEYITNDARLTLETIQSAAASGARVASYAGVVAMEDDPIGLRVTVEDTLAGSQLVIRARCVVNAAGPWFDRVRGLRTDDGRSMVQLTRGIHLVVPRSRFPVSHVVVLRAPDGRSAFVVPRGDLAYIGTTDTEYAGDPAEPGVVAEDVEYLLASAAATFEDAPTASDVIGAWSGVRPLLRQDGKKPSEISRRDEILRGPGPFISIAGGKLTTYRRMAERVVDSMRDLVGSREQRRVDSASIALAGGSVDEQGAARAAARRLDDAVLDDRLWATYGVAAADIVDRIHADPAGAERVGGLECLTRAELEHAVDGEMVTSLDDLLRRRSHVAMFQTGSALGAAGDAAALLGERLGWSAADAAREVADFARDRKIELATARRAGTAATAARTGSE